MKNLFIALMLLISFQSIAQTEIKHYVTEETAKLDLPFSNAVIVGDMIYVSGNIGMVPGKGILAPGGIKAETRQTLENIKAVLEANGSSLDNAVKLTVMLADINEWGAMNEVYKEFFPNKRPARSAFGTSGLALNARLEIECIALIKKQK